MSTKWQVIIEKQAKKTLKKLPRPLKKRIQVVIDNLANNPFPSGHRKITGQENVYRIRVGDWRISYAVHENVLIILIVEIASRGNAYKQF